MLNDPLIELAVIYSVPEAVCQECGKDEWHCNGYDCDQCGKFMHKWHKVGDLIVCDNCTNYYSED